MAKVLDKGIPKRISIPEWTFGNPTLVSGGLGRIYWDKAGPSRAVTGFAVRMIPGAQTSWDDYSHCKVPVNNMPLTDLTDAKWQYQMTATEAMGLGLVIHVHNPKDFDQEAEISMACDTATLDKASGYNSHELNTSTAYLNYYGYSTDSDISEGVNTSLIGFQQDAQFDSWVIDAIGIAYGYHTGGAVFDAALLYNFEVNGINIPIKPQGSTFRKDLLITKTLENEGGYSDGDVMSNSDTASAGTDWDIDFGGTGEITKAIIHTPTTAMTFRTRFYLYSSPPTCELDDNAANTGPAVADVPYFVGIIDFPAMTDDGTGGSWAIATPSTLGGLPLEFNAPIIYGVAVILDGQDPADDTLLSILLSARLDVD